MDARPVPALALPDHSSADGAVLVRWGVPVAIGLLGSMALLLAARRLAGALVEPLETPQLLATGVAAALAAWGLRWLWHVGRPLPTATWLDTVILWIPLAAVAVIAAALSLPEASRLGLAGLWAVLIVAEIDIHRRAGGTRSGSSHFGDRNSPSVSPPMAHTLEAPHAPSDALGEEVLQQLTRARNTDGCEVLYGVLRADLAPDQRNETLHVAFCPPFARVPRVEIEQADGPEARIKLAQVLAYGARLEVRLASVSSERSSVLVKISIHSEPPGDRAG